MSPVAFACGLCRRLSLPFPLPGDSLHSGDGVGGDCPGDPAIQSSAPVCQIQSSSRDRHCSQLQQALKWEGSPSAGRGCQRWDQTAGTSVCSPPPRPSPSPRLRGPAISCQSSLHGCTMMGQDDSGRAPWAPPAPWGLVSSGPTALAGLLSPSQLQTESPKRRPTTRSTQWEARSRAEPQGMGSPQLLELCLPQAPGQS